MAKSHDTRLPPDLAPPPAFPARDMEFLTQSLARLREVEALEPDWDTYGSPRPTLAALARAREVLGFLASISPSVPAVVPVPGGGVQMEWQNGARGLELEIRPDGALEFLQVDGDHMTEGPLDPARPEL